MDPHNARHALMTTHLQMAVPLEIERLRGADPATLRQLAADAAHEIHERGDVLQYGGPGASQTMAALTRALAVLALTAWGGVTFAGLHWCADWTCHDRDAHHDAPTWPDEARIDPPGRRHVEDVHTSGLT
jgi:hypothetical protein